jgi:GT2 family glycosyltransferase
MDKSDCNTELRPKRQNAVTFCVINFNGEMYLEATLNSILDQMHKGDEVILVDNCSTDRSLQIVNRQLCNIKIIQLNQNLGPGAARNEGFQIAMNDWVCFIDNDVSINIDCLDYLIAALEENPMAVAAMPRVLYASNSNIIQYDGADAHYLGLMQLHNENAPTKSADDAIKKISSIVSACLLINRKNWSFSELFDKSFFIYLEDHDFGMKARLLGHELLSVPHATVLHREGTRGLSLREQGKYSQIRVYNLIKNRWQIILKFYKIKTLAILLPIIFFYEFIQFLAIIKKGWLKEWLISAKWIIFNIQSVLAKRRILQKRRINKDREILNGGSLPFSSYLTQSKIEKFGLIIINKIVSMYWEGMNRLI